MELDGLMMRHMNYGVRKKLSVCLDVEMPVSGHNWKMLAEKLGYCYEDIQGLESRQTQHGSNTQKLFEEHGVKRDSTVQNLWNHLEAMERPDAIEVLEKALPDIRKAYEKEQRETRARCLTNMSRNSPYINGCNSHPVFGRHTSEPYGNGHSQYHQQDHCYLPLPNSCPQEHSSVNSSRSHKSRNRASSSPAGSCHVPCSPVCLCHQTSNQSQPSYSSISGCASSISDVRSHHGDVRKIQNIPTSRVSGQPYHRMVSVEDNNVNYSMEVCHGDSEVVARQQDFNTMQMNIPSVPERRDPARLEEVLLRHLPYSGSDNIPSVKEAGEMDVAAEEEVFTSSDSSSSTTSNPGPVFENPTKVVHKRLSAKNSQVRPEGCHAHFNGNSVHVHYQGQQNHRMINGTQESHRHVGLNHSYTASPSGTNCKPVHQNSVQHNNGTRHVHEMCPCCQSNTRHCCASSDFSGHNGNVNHGMLSQPSNQAVCRTADTNTRQPRANHFAVSNHSEMSQVVPNPGSGVLSRGTLGGGAISKTTQKVKLSDICKESRQVKVFLTYVCDSDKHRKRVISLSECLTQNGFSSSLDIQEPSEMMDNKIRWYQTHFRDAYICPCLQQGSYTAMAGQGLSCTHWPGDVIKTLVQIVQKADFVLLCLSPLYKEQTDYTHTSATPTHPASPADYTLEDDIHTGYIYHLMLEEWKRNSAKNRRFIPLMFPDATRDHVPIGLRNTLVYNWPSQYKDLFWMMTSPQKRVFVPRKRYNSNSME